MIQTGVSDDGPCQRLCLLCVSGDALCLRNALSGLCSFVQPKKELWHRLGSEHAFPIWDAKSHTQACLSPGPLYYRVCYIMSRAAMHVNWDPWDLCQLLSWHILYWSWQLSPITLIIHKHCLLCVCFCFFSAWVLLHPGSPDLSRRRRVRPVCSLPAHLSHSAESALLPQVLYVPY